MALTPKQERFAQLIALEGLSQSDAYRQAYDVKPDTGIATINENSHKLSKHNGVVLRVEELTEGIQAQAIGSAQQVLEYLKKIGFRDPEGTVRVSDQVNALDKMAKILGLYRDADTDRGKAVAISQITVVLTGGRTEMHEVAQYPPDGVIEGKRQALPQDETDPHG